MSAIAPEALHTPTANVEVTAPEVAVVRLPALMSERVNVTVTLGESTSLTTISNKSREVSSVYDSAASRFVAVGAAFADCVVIVREY